MTDGDTHDQGHLNMGCSRHWDYVANSQGIKIQIELCSEPFEAHVGKLGRRNPSGDLRLKSPNHRAAILPAMVYYFKSTAVDPPAFIYAGKDKVESAFSSAPGPARLTAQMRI
jgi:hypothetical protein